MRVNFKPIVRSEAPQPKGILTLTPVNADGKPLNGTCMTSVGKGGGSTCYTCSFLDEKMEFLRQETPVQPRVEKRSTTHGIRKQREELKPPVLRPPPRERAHDGPPQY